MQPYTMEDAIADILGDRLDEARINAEYHKIRRMVRAPRDPKSKAEVLQPEKRHFGIVSPHRTFSTHGQGGVYQHPEGAGVTPEESISIHANDNELVQRVGAVRGLHTQNDKITHNVAAWHKMRGAILDGGWRVGHAHGVYPENGAPKATGEGSFVIGGRSSRGRTLTQAHVEKLAKDYGQDSYIYAGPESGGKVKLHSAIRTVHGITGYDEGFELGSAEHRKWAGMRAGLEHPDAESRFKGATQPIRTPHRSDVQQGAQIGRMGGGKAFRFDHNPINKLNSR